MAEGIVLLTIKQAGGSNTATMLILLAFMEMTPPMLATLGNPGKVTWLRSNKSLSKYENPLVCLALALPVENAELHSISVLMRNQADELVVRPQSAHVNPQAIVGDMICS